MSIQCIEYTVRIVSLRMTIGKKCREFLQVRFMGKQMFEVCFIAAEGAKRPRLLWSKPKTFASPKNSLARTPVVCFFQ